MHSSQTVIVDDYVFPLSGLLSRTESRECLRSYLIAQKNVEQLEFLEAIEQLEVRSRASRTTIGSIRPHLLSIVRTFLDHDSVKEVNLSHKDKIQLKAMLEVLLNSPDDERVTKRSIREAFRNVRTIIETEMTSEVIPRFLRSNEWNFLVTRIGTSFIRELGCPKHNMDFSDEDFYDPVVTVKDINFAKNIIQETNDWKLSGFNRKQNIQCFKSKSMPRFLRNVSWPHGCLKYSGILSIPFEVCNHFMMHVCYRKEFDRMVRDVTLLEHYSHEELVAMYPDKKLLEGTTCSVIDSDVDFGPIFLRRQSINVLTAIWDVKGNQALMIAKPCYHPNLGSDGRCVYQNFSICSLEKLDDHRTKYTQIHILNLGSSVANKSLTFLACQRAKNLEYWLTKCLQTKVSHPIPSNYLLDPVMKCYHDYKLFMERKARATTENQK